MACTGQPSGGDANSTSAPKYPYRFHCYTSHIYVDASGHASKASSKDVIGYFGFGLL